MRRLPDPRPAKPIGDMRREEPRKKKGRRENRHIRPRQKYQREKSQRYDGHNAHLLPCSHRACRIPETLHRVRRRRPLQHLAPPYEKAIQCDCHGIHLDRRFVGQKHDGRQPTKKIHPKRSNIGAQIGRPSPHDRRHRPGEQRNHWNANRH